VLSVDGREAEGKVQAVLRLQLPRAMAQQPSSPAATAPTPSNPRTALQKVAKGLAQVIAEPTKSQPRLDGSAVFSPLQAPALSACLVLLQRN
jgi:hypothetical protein